MLFAAPLRNPRIEKLYLKEHSEVKRVAETMNKFFSTTLRFTLFLQTLYLRARASVFIYMIKQSIFRSLMLFARNDLKKDI